MYSFIYLLIHILYIVCMCIYNYILQGWEVDQVDRLPFRIFLIESLKITLSQNGW